MYYMTFMRRRRPGTRWFWSVIKIFIFIYGVLVKMDEFNPKNHDIPGMSSMDPNPHKEGWTWGFEISNAMHVAELIIN